MEKSTVLETSKQFAIRMVKLYKYLTGEKREFVLSKQILRSGTSIGANIHEAQYAESPADFLHKMYIALKETSETEFWLLLLKEGEFITESEHQSILTDCKNLLRMLIAITKTKKQNLNK